MELLNSMHDRWYSQRYTLMKGLNYAIFTKYFLFSILIAVSIEY